jgi:hypothetical protein
VSIKGDLKGVGLYALIQMICQEGKNGVLLLRQGQHRGGIFFHHGEIVHAATGTQVGAEAFFRLLGWEEGAFAMREGVKAPQRTIDMPWNYLLIEGVRLLDEEKKTQKTTTRPLTRAEVAQDQDFENDLIHLLSNLEYTRAQLVQRKIRRHPEEALAHLAGMINDVTTFIEEHLPALVNTNALENALNQAWELYPQARLLQPEHHRLSPQTVQNLYNSWKGNPTGRKQTFSQVALGMVDVLETYASHLVDHFNATTMTEQWRETCGVFIRELKHGLQQIRF